jgi:HSP20 family protein
MNSIVQEFSRNQDENELLTTSGFVPPVDIYEDEHQLTLKLVTPGIRQEDLDVQVENHTLTIRGERRIDKDEKEENFRRIEHHYGSFSRTFTLPNTIDTSNVKAEYENGVLRLVFERRAEAKPKQIKVNVAPAGGKQIESAKPAAAAESSKPAA